MTGGGRAGAPGSLPRTPHHLRHGQGIDERIRSLEAKWNLGLKIRGTGYSPQQGRKDDPANRVYGLVQLLFHSSRTELDQATATFDELAQETLESNRLNLLISILRSKAKKYKDGQVSKTATTMNDPPKSFTSFLNASSPHPRGLFRPVNHEEPGSHSNLIDPGSPTDVDTDEDVEIPRSPSPLARSAQRRLKASPRVFSQPSARKRLSDSSDRSENSPKFAKTFDGKTTSRPPVSAPMQTPSLFKKPSLDMARSFQAPTSFSSTNTSFKKSVISSQGTTTTANTSFSSYNGAADPQESKWIKKGSVLAQSTVEQSFLHKVPASGQETSEGVGQRQNKRMVPQDMSQGNRSTFGSIDEDGLLDASSKVESEMRLKDVPTTGTSDNFKRRTSADSLRGQNSPTEGRYHRMPHATDMSLTACFPPLRPFKTDHSLKKTSIRTPVSSKSVSSLTKFPQDSAAGNSPPKEPHYIRDIPKKNLFVDVFQQKIHGVPYFVLFICQRIAIASCLSLQQLLQDIDISSVFSKQEAFWSAIQIHSDRKVSRQKPQESIRIWQAEKHQFEGYTFKGQISFNTKEHGPVFSLQLSPIQADLSCRFERKFGSDRFLYLSVPVFDTQQSPRFKSLQIEQIKIRWNQWLMKEHDFLGRKWRAFHDKPLKRSKGSRKDTTHDKRITLFATEGWGIQDPMTIGDMLNWFFPLALNEKQSFCKAFARIDLGFTRSVSTLEFKPSQIEFVDDKQANGEKEDATFNDWRLSWDKIPKGKVMNDGCSEMSVGAARKIWQLYKKQMRMEDHLPLPSVFQGRIGGAKGLWMISGESFSRDPKHTDIWIKISESQLKFFPHEKDRNDMTYDKFRLTFEVRDYSSGPSPSDLHISFIPIMVDRGIPREAMADFMNESLDADRAQLLDVVTEPLKMHDWIYRNGFNYCNGSEVSWQASLPIFLEDRINFLLESGFDPTKFLCLADSIGQFITRRQSFQEMSLRTPLGKSTYLFGVADPVGILKPGEVHVQFSARFVDKVTGDTYLNLRNLEILVARQPACRRSDIQKVHAVVCPELEHLIDVVVFPSRGERPLAGKLQGGDYDGDIFWLCWESKLVAEFKNAPAPVQDPNPENYKIQTNKQQLKDIMNTRNLQEVDVFLRKAFEFRSHPSLLGKVTVFLEKQAYRENKISSPTLEMLCDLHDLLVDAPKQGYTFTSKHFTSCIRDVLKLRSEPREPDYKMAMEACKPVKESGGGNGGRKTVKPPTEAKNNSNQLLDYLYFDVLGVHNKETLKSVEGLFLNAAMADDVLQYPYEHLMGKGHELFNEELCSLQEKIYKINRRWNSGFKNGLAAEQENAFVDECYREFRALRPIHEDHPEIKPWLEPCSWPNSLSWDYIRASTLYVWVSRTKKHHFAFKMAGRELAQMKAESFANVRHVIPRIHANMRPKRIKAPADYEEEEEDVSENEYGSSIEYFSA